MRGGFPMVWAKAAEPAGLLCLGTTISQRQGEGAASPKTHHLYSFILNVRRNSREIAVEEVPSLSLPSMNFSCSLMGGGFHIWL